MQMMSQLRERFTFQHLPNFVLVMEAAWLHCYHWWETLRCLCRRDYCLNLKQRRATYMSIHFIILYLNSMFMSYVLLYVYVIFHKEKKCLRNNFILLYIGPVLNHLKRWIENMLLLFHRQLNGFLIFI